MISVSVACLVLAQGQVSREQVLAAEVVKRVNVVRAKAGLPELATHKLLEGCSQALAVDLAARKILEHQDRRGRKLPERLDAVGYTNWTSIGENIAFGQTTADEVVSDWLKSPGHRKMIYEPAFNETGVSVVASRDGTLYWVQQFGRRS